MNTPRKPGPPAPVQKKRLGERGLRYVREQLTDAAPLSEALTRYLDSGYAWEFVTDEQSQSSEEHDFHFGGRGSQTVLNGYVKFLCELLNKEPSTILLFENQHAKLTDPVMTGKTGLFERLGALYFYLQGGEGPRSENVVIDHLRWASRYPSVVIATRMSKPLHIEQPRSLTPEEATELETGVKHVLVGAYDEEGYVAWSRQE
jgi:hypothetical protein